VTANTLAVLYADAGFEGARIPRLKGHEATEVYYDGARHLFDGDLQACHRRHPPEEETIASYADCLADPTLVSRQQNPSEPYYLPDTDDRMLPGDAGGEYEIVYRIDAPPHGRLRRLFVHSSVRGRGEEDEPAGRVAGQWAAEKAGPWQDLYDEPVAVVPHRWHFSVEGRAVLDRPREGG